MSLGGLAHLDFNDAGAHSYEQALLAIRHPQLPMAAIEELFRRMVFNLVARNQDDHVKNIAFLMDKTGTWSLAPAFDVTYSYNPSGAWTASHQMSVQGKRDGVTRADTRAAGRTAGLRQARADVVLDEVVATVSRWPEFAASAQVPDEETERIGRTHRLFGA